MNITEISKAVSNSGFKRPNKLNILIVDASGSMCWAMKQLASDVIERVNNLPMGDAVLIGLFSTQGWFKWIAARELSSSKDVELVKGIVNSEFYTRGMTCFSEIVADVPQAIKPFLGKFNVVTLTFMSDGHPVVSNTMMEENALLKAADEVKNYLTSSAVIAYGDYANRPLLSKLSKSLGAEFVTAQNITEIGNTFTKLSGGTATKKKKIQMPKEHAGKFLVGIDGESVFVVDSNSPEVPETARVLAYSGCDKSIVNSDPADVYAVALAKLQIDDIDEALKLMSTIGDVAIVNAINNSLTNAELARAEGLVRAAMVDKSARFVGGCVPNCLPPDDAFDIIDLLTLLKEGDNKFYPYHKDFHYKRTGRGSVPVEGYPKFVPDNVGVSFSSLVGHERELNMSVNTSIPGFISLPDESNGIKWEGLGLTKAYPTSIIRSYSFINNAIPVITKLPVSVDGKTFTKLQMHGTIDSSEYFEENQVYTLDLTKVPACNKLKGKTSTNWVNLCTLAINSYETGCMLKVYKAKKAELDPDGEADKPTNLTADQITFLEGCGVVTKSGVFSPPTTAAEPTDVLDVRVFEIKIAKSSSVTMKDFNLMLEGKKNWNGTGMLMKRAYDDITAEMPASKGAAIEWLKKRIATLTSEKRSMDSEIAAAKYAIILGGHWNKNFKEDEQLFKVEGYDVTLAVRTIQKQI